MDCRNHDGRKPNHTLSQGWWHAVPVLYAVMKAESSTCPTCGHVSKGLTEPVRVIKSADNRASLDKGFAVATERLAKDLHITKEQATTKLLNADPGLYSELERRPTLPPAPADNEPTLKTAVNAAIVRKAREVMTSGGARDLGAAVGEVLKNEEWRNLYSCIAYPSASMPVSKAKEQLGHIFGVEAVRKTLGLLDEN
jgi:hypothetical protein